MEAGQPREGGPVVLSDQRGQLLARPHDVRMHVSRTPCVIGNANNLMTDSHVLNRFFWHAIMAFFIWAWVVRDRDVGMLQRQVPLAFALASLVSAGVTVIPIRNHNLGLWPHRYGYDAESKHRNLNPSHTDTPPPLPSDCFVRKSWWGPHQPTTGVMLDRMILLPLSWLAILVFNVWSIIHLRGETGRFLTLTSIKRLQLRLVLITVTFIVIWVLMSIPLYANTRTFALELSVKWAFSIGFVDAMIYGTWSQNPRHRFQ